jgi:translation initiation factor 2B subunit (eIF-2B alpha/beta/delta family)
MREFKHSDRIDRELTRIADDRRSGASELAGKAVGLFALTDPAGDVSATRYVRAIDRLFKRVQKTRPAMAPVESVVARLAFEFAQVEAQSAEAAHEALVWLTRRLEAELANIGDRVARRFESRFGRLRRPLLISYSSSVTRAVRALLKPRVTVCESRPAFEGRRTARLLRANVGSVTLVTESQIGPALDDCDSVVMGCDAIHPDGSIVNKMGSYLLALAARDKHRPVIVVGDTYKLCRSIKGPFESHPAAQVWRGGPDRIVVRNVAFENVPGHLVDYVVLESGVYRSRGVRSVWERVRKKRLDL